MSEEVFTKGKKKEAVSRVRIKKGKEAVKINNKPLKLYDPNINRKMIKEPIRIAKEVIEEEDIDKLNIKANTKGGGNAGQTIATRTAIGKALVKWTDSEELEEVFMDYDRSLLIDDYRRKEPKKALRKGARARPTKSYR